MSSAEQKAANILSLDRSINRGDSFIFSNNPNQARIGSGFEMESNYLRSRGIDIDKIPVIEPW